MTAIILGAISCVLMGFTIGWFGSLWLRHKNDGSSLRDLDKWSGRF